MNLFKKYRNVFGVLAILALIGTVLAGAWSRNRQEPEFIEYTLFIEALETGRVESVTLGDGAVVGFTMAGSEGRYITNNPRREDFKEHLLLMGAAVEENSSANMMQLGISVVLVAAALLFVRGRSAAVRAGSGFNSGPVAVGAGHGQIQCGFDNVAGNLEAKESIKDIVDYLREPERFTRYGARMPRGILFHGKPGTGKTLMARAMAGEAGVPFYAVSGSDFVQMYVGVGAARVRDLFKKAREAGRGVIFIDEIDALGKKRSDGVNGNDEREQTLNALLTEMQGFQEGRGIVVVAATNRPDTLDEALLRPGRFDRRVEIGLPDINARREILGLHSEGKPLSNDVDLDKLARDTVFFSGAMLEGLLNDAAISAARRGGDNILPEDITTAYYTALAGSEKKDRSHIREQERTVTAWHESGHAVAAVLTNPENRVAKVTIIPSTSGAGGFCVNIPPERMYYTKSELRGQMMVSLAGRAAEELRFGADGVTTGASNDIEKATSTAMQYVTKFGMGGTLADRTVLKDEKGVSRECAELVDSLYRETLVLLKENYPAMESLAGELLTHETIDGDAVAEITRRYAPYVQKHP